MTDRSGLREKMYSVEARTSLRGRGGGGGAGVDAGDSVGGATLLDTLRV
jgi:hypothetical protein